MVFKITKYSKKKYFLKNLIYEEIIGAIINIFTEYSSLGNYAFLESCFPYYSKFKGKTELK